MAFNVSFKSCTIALEVGINENVLTKILMLDKDCTIIICYIIWTNRFYTNVILKNEIIFDHFRDMCSAEDTEVENSALKLREDDQQQIIKKSNCCNK